MGSGPFCGLWHSVLLLINIVEVLINHIMELPLTIVFVQLLHSHFSQLYSGLVIVTNL